MSDAVRKSWSLSVDDPSRLHFEPLADYLKATHLREREAGLQQLRERLLVGMLLVCALAGAVAYFPSVFAAWRTGLTDVVVVDTLVYAWVLAVLFAPGVGFVRRAQGLILPTIVLAMFLLLRLGADGAGFMWLGLSPVLAALLLG